MPTLPCHLRFVYWNDATQRYEGAPAGLLVEAWDRDLLFDDLLGAAVVGEDGRVALEVDLSASGERRPDLFFRVHVPDGVPAVVDLLSGAFSGAPARPLPWPPVWDSRDDFALGQPDTRGYWADFAGHRVGTPDSPYVFDVLDRRPGPLDGTAATPLIDGVAFLSAFEEVIRGARHTLHLETMLYFNDELGQHITDLLVEAAGRGVVVRALIDVANTRTIHQLLYMEKVWARHLRRIPEPALSELLAYIDRELAEEKVRADVEPLLVRLRATPGVTVLDTSIPKVELLPGPIDYAPEAYRALEDNLPFFSLARVDHRKILVADGRVAVLGGQNVGREYMYREPFDPAVKAEDEPWHRWHDCSVRLEGPAVREVQRLYRERWVLEGGDAFDAGPAEAAVDPDHPTFPLLGPREGGVPVEIVETTPSASMRYHQTLLGMIRRARREVLIEDPYFASGEALDALCAAARRGGRVVFVFPDDRNDSIDFLYAGRLAYPALIDAGVEVYEYANHMNHSKVALVDHAALIGSANINHSSFFNHYEICAVVHDAAWTARFRQALIEVDLPRSTRVGPGDTDRLLDINAAARLYVEGVVRRLF